MCIDDAKSCKRCRTALKLFIRPDSPKLNRQIFIHSLPSPLPGEKTDIIDLVLQLILILLEQFKPEPDDNGDNGDTAFPRLAAQSADLARQHVDPTTLSRTTALLSDSIALTVHELRKDGLVTIREARETMRQANHAALASHAMSWSTWNTAVRTILDTYAHDGRLKQLHHYLDAWTQISKGLKTI